MCGGGCVRERGEVRENMWQIIRDGHETEAMRRFAFSVRSDAGIKSVSFCIERVAVTETSGD